MADRIWRLANDPDQRALAGAANRRRAAAEFAPERSLAKSVGLIANGL